MKFYEVVDLEIHEIDATLAPVCLTTENTEVRYFEDAFWYPVSSQNEYDHACHLPTEREPSHIDFLGSLQGIDTPGIKYHLNNITNSAFGLNRHHLNGRVERYDPHDLKEIDQANRAVAHEELEERARGTMLIDGWLWTKADAPVLELLSLHQGVVCWNVTPASYRDYQSFTGRCAVFDVTDKKETIESLVRVYMNDLTDDANLAIPDRHILMPEVIRPTAAPLQFARMASEAGSRWWRTMPHSYEHLSGPQMMHFGDLKTAIERVTSDPTMETAIELERVARAVMNYERTPEVTTDLLRKAVAYFEDASLSHDLEVDGGFVPGR